MQSPTKRTVVPGISSCIFSATGRNEVSAEIVPLGRPRWDSTIDLGAFPRKSGDGRQHARDAGRVGDGAVFDRHVEVDADQHALALHVDPVDGPDAGEVETARRALPSARAMTARSYQPTHGDGRVGHAVGEAPFVVVPGHDAAERAVDHMRAR